MKVALKLYRYPDKSAILTRTFMSSVCNLMALTEPS